MSLKSDDLNLHFRRFEFKYHLERAVADRMIPQMMKYMVWDEFAEGDNGYNVHSIYFDSPDFKNYHEKIDGIMNRKKARIRSYSDIVEEGSDLFLELKRKSGDVILKDRIVVKGADFAKFRENPFYLNNQQQYQGAFLNEFLYEIGKYRMKPVCNVSYLRKPFFSKFDRSFRVTFDYDLEFSNAEGMHFENFRESAYNDLVILEVKFNSAMPKWFHEIIEMFRMNKDTFSKYCAAIEHVYGVPKYF